jgi:hypothetical protein
VIDYNPPIASRSTDELWEIALDDGDNWQVDAVMLAKVELKKRGVTDLEFSDQKRLADKLDQEARVALEKELDKRKTESFHPLQMIPVFLFAPFYLFGRFVAKQTIWDLKAEGYSRMYRQRLTVLLLGTATWILIICLIS